MTSTVTKICIDLGVEFIRSNEAYRPMATKCEAILNRVALKFGNEHLILLLRTIVESDGNQTALVEPVIWAVSDIIRGHPEWTDRGLEWLEAFDTIDLCHLLAVARANRASVPRRASIASKFDRPAPDPKQPLPPPRQAPVAAVAAAGDILRGMDSIAKYLGLEGSYVTFLIAAGQCRPSRCPGVMLCARASPA
jgi:hypothetical protein